MSKKINYSSMNFLQNNEEHVFDHKLSNKHVSSDTSLYKPVHSADAHRPVPDYGRILDFENSSVLLFKIISLFDHDKKNNKIEITPPLFRMYKKNPQQVAYEKNAHLRGCFLPVNGYKNAQFIYHNKNSIILEGGIKYGNIQLKREGDSLILEIKPMPGQMWTQSYDSFIIEHYFHGSQPGKAYDIHFRSDAQVLSYQDIVKKINR